MSPNTTATCVVHTNYYNHLDNRKPQEINVCRVCGKCVGTWTDKVEVVCWNCVKKHKTIEGLEWKREDNISQPVTYYDKNDINTNRDTIV